MKKIMSRPVIVGKLEDSITTIAKIMKEHNIGFLPIVKKDKIVGVITDRDLVIQAVANNEDTNKPIENYITHHIISIDRNGTIDELLSLMAQYQVKRILVTENNKAVGVIAFSDLLTHVDNDTLIDVLRKIDINPTYHTEENLEIDSFYL